MDLGQRAACAKFLIRDRAGQFAESFDAVSTADGNRILLSPSQAPRASAICERMIGTVRREFVDQLLIVNERHLCRVLIEYLIHYNTARPHRTHPRPVAVGSSSCPATADRPRRTPGTPKAGSRRPHVRISDRRLTAVRLGKHAGFWHGTRAAGMQLCCSQPRMGFSARTGCRPWPHEW